MRHFTPPKKAVTAKHPSAAAEKRPDGTWAIFDENGGPAIGTGATGMSGVAQRGRAASLTTTTRELEDM